MPVMSVDMRLDEQLSFPQADQAKVGAVPMGASNPQKYHFGSSCQCLKGPEPLIVWAFSSCSKTSVRPSVAVFPSSSDPAKTLSSSDPNKSFSSNDHRHSFSGPPWRALPVQIDYIDNVDCADFLIASLGSAFDAIMVCRSIKWARTIYLASVEAMHIHTRRNVRPHGLLRTAKEQQDIRTSVG
jgi:hypothetical protein